MNGRKSNKPNRISRYIVKEIKELKKTKTFVSNRKGYVISDSKGKDLVHLKGKKYVQFFYKGGADINNREIQAYAKHVILNKRNKYPVLLFWFGTCSLTKKTNGGLFEVKDNLNQVVEDTIISYRETKLNLLSINPRAKIIFLECPYYSLSMYNQHRQKTFEPNYFIKQQRELVNAIDLHNELVRNLNNFKKIPNFNKDFSTRVKRKNHQKIRRSVDYKQLRDGCHIGPKLAELWLIRIQRLVYRI